MCLLYQGSCQEINNGSVMQTFILWLDGSFLAKLHVWCVCVRVPPGMYVQVRAGLWGDNSNGKKVYHHITENVKQ